MSAIAPCAGQTFIDFAALSRSAREPSDDWLKWLTEVWGCPEAQVAPYVRRLFDAFGPVEAGARCKALQHFFWRHHRPAFDEIAPETLGLFEPIDYHVVWDRCFAVEQGMEPLEAASISGWDYGKGRPYGKEESE